MKTVTIHSIKFHQKNQVRECYVIFYVSYDPRLILVIGKRKTLSDSTNVRTENSFVSNKKPTFNTVVELTKISIVTDDENSNDTAPSSRRDTQCDTKGKDRQEAKSCPTAQPSQGPVLTILQLPAAMWCSSIPRVPEIDLLRMPSNVTHDADSRFARDPEFVAFQVGPMYETFFAAERRLQAHSGYMDTQINFTEKNRQQMVHILVRFSHFTCFFAF